MATPHNNHALLQAQSIVGWWKMAGVDYFVGEEAIDWLAAPPEPPAVAEPSRAPANRTPRPAPAEIAIPVPLPPQQWPMDLTALNAAIAADRTLPGTGYGRHILKPNGMSGAPFMVISDFPEESELAAGELGRYPLLSAMLLAAGIRTEQCYFAALAYSRPASGALPDADKALLADFIRHQIGLVKPQMILLLGSSATECLLSKDLMKARGNLENINHDGHNMAALATFHPRTLAARPILKPQAWRDLQMVMQRDSA